MAIVPEITLAYLAQAYIIAIGRTLTDLLMLTTFTGSEAGHGGSYRGGWSFSSADKGSLISH